MRSSEKLLIIASLSFFSLLRLFPYLRTGVPYSMDSLGLIRNALVFSSHSPISLFSDLFDGYNNFWPGASILASSLSIVIGGEIVKVSSLLPAYAFFSTALLFSLLGRGLRRGTSIAITSAILGSTTGILMLQGSLIKEGFAYPLLGLFLYLLFRRESSLRTGILLVLTSFSLAFTHHFTTLIAVLIAVFFLISDLFKSISFGTPKIGFHILSSLEIILPSSIQFFLLGRYSTLSLATPWLAISLFSSLFLTASLFSLSSPYIERRMREVKIASLFSILILSMVSLSFYKAFGLEQLPPSTYLLATAFALLLSSAILTAEGGDLNDFWIPFFSVLSLMLFALSEDIPMKVAILERSATFLIFPLATMLSMRGKGLRIRRASALSFSLIMLLVYLLVQAGVFISPGWHWIYHEDEFEAESFLQDHYRIGESIMSDIKQEYLLSSYGNLSSSLWNGSIERGNILYSSYMDREGMLLNTGYVMVLEKISFSALCHMNSIVYSNREEVLFVG
ncbi:MAG: hypothetical protein C0179_08165 [Fervidicoccus sp.]|nr:MAG: hypothetical protein C0179_08165 [Fervidicoccus sp.]